MRTRQFVPPLFVAALGLASVAALFSIAAAIGLTLMATFYLAVCVAASVHRCQRDVRVLLLLPVIFVTLHVTYGAGFLTGLVRFRRRWFEPEALTAPA
jgi:hypothetical protein